MNTELLEKMRYLHSCGFEPDMNFVDDAVSAYFIFHNNGLGTPSLARSDYQPWFTESRLWSLLPRSISLSYEKYPAVSNANKLKDGNWDIGFTKQIDDYSVGYVDLLNYFQVAVKTKDKDLHAALLDLVVWAVTEGHLKAEDTQ